MISSYLAEDLELISKEYEKLGFGGSTIAVTGSTGLIGSLLVKGALLYNQKYTPKITIIAFARNIEKTETMFGHPENLIFVYQDIRDPIPEMLCDYIVHTASPTSSRSFITRPVEVIDSIYTGSRQVLEFAKKAHVKGMVCLSSMEVFGRVDAGHRISERELGYVDLHDIRSCYPEGKRLVECLCQSYAEEYGVPVRIARLAQTFGAGVLPGENRVFAQFARSVLASKDIVLHTPGRSMGNYVYTRDAVKAILLLLVKGRAGGAYTVVNENTTMTIREMAEMVAKEISNGKSEVIFEIPEEDRYGYAPDTQMRLSSALLRRLGWKPEVDLSEMYQRMLPDLSD